MLKPGGNPVWIKHDTKLAYHSIECLVIEGKVQSVSLTPQNTGIWFLFTSRVIEHGLIEVRHSVMSVGRQAGDQGASYNTAPRGRFQNCCGVYSGYALGKIIRKRFEYQRYQIRVISLWYRSCKYLVTFRPAPPVVS